MKTECKNNGSSFKLNVNLTFSKIMSFMILLAGTIVSYKVGSEYASGVFMATCGSVTTILVGRQAANTFKTPKQ